jgi:hypothetical protein
MGLLVAALCLVTGCSGALPPSGSPSDMGGSVMRYHTAVERLKDTGEDYRAPFDCRSACTMLMDAPSVCWPKNGTLGFHSASSDVPLGSAIIDQTNRLIAGHYPRALRNWFLSDDGPGGQRSTRIVTISVATLNSNWGADLAICGSRSSD